MGEEEETELDRHGTEDQGGTEDGVGVGDDARSSFSRSCITLRLELDLSTLLNFTTGFEENL